MEQARLAWNKEFSTNFNAQNWTGTNAYRFAYVFVQTQIEQHTAIAEIFTKLRDFFDLTNSKIANPKTTTNSLIAQFWDAGFQIAIRDDRRENNENGGLAVAVDISNTDENAGEKIQQIAQILKDNTAAGLKTFGDISVSLSLSNGQDKTFNFSLANRIPTLLRLTLQEKSSASYSALNEQTVKEQLLKNLKEMYQIGNDFEPQRYFEIYRDAPQAVKILLQYSNDKTSGNFTSDIYVSDYRDVFSFSDSGISVIITK
jgi:hypothetical protein